MVTELQPLGVKCNIRCGYCYENPQRDAGNVLHSYDMEKMKAGLEKVGGPFSLFGGEPLMIPDDDLEEIFSWGFQKYGRNLIQTNGVLLTPHHILMFQRYRVSVGISVDGPGELNDVRWAGSLERTREATSKAHAAIERLCKEGVPPGLIITLHRNNATREKLPLMHDWIRHLENLGITSVRLHNLEVEDESMRQKYSLTIQENIDAFLSFAELEAQLTKLRFDIFKEIRDLLLGRDKQTSCVWDACDPYTTQAVQGVRGDGQSNNCGRTNKDGIDFAKANTVGFERYLALYHTPQEYGGCKGCRFFLMCKGQCPGTAIDGDWRNRTEHCEVWKELYGHFEKELLEKGLSPLSLSVVRVRLENLFLQKWAAGQHTTIAAAMEQNNISA